MVKDKTATVLKADSTDVSKLETSSTEHCNVQETGIAVEKLKRAETVPALTEQSESEPSDNQPKSALHVVTKKEETSLPETRFR